MKENSMKLEELRAQIDAIDNELLALLAKRISIVEKVGHLKHANGTKGSFIRPKREDDMMKRILQKGAGNFPKAALFSIWRTIISASLQVENPFRVITTKDIGKEVYEYFGAFTEYVMFDTPDEVFKHISPTDVGVLPKKANIEKIPGDMKLFAEIGKFNAFANVEDVV